MPSPTVAVHPYGDGTGRSEVRRPVLAAPGVWVDARVVRRDTLRIGDRLAGPAIVEEPDSTTYVPPDFAAEVHPTWCLIVEPAPSEAER